MEILHLVLHFFVFLYYSSGVNIVNVYSIEFSSTSTYDVCSKFDDLKRLTKIIIPIHNMFKNMFFHSHGFSGNVHVAQT